MRAEPHLQSGVSVPILMRMPIHSTLSGIVCFNFLVFLLNAWARWCPCRAVPGPILTGDSCSLIAFLPAVGGIGVLHSWISRAATSVQASALA